MQLVASNISICLAPKHLIFYYDFVSPHQRLSDFFHSKNILFPTRYLHIFILKILLLILKFSYFHPDRILFPTKKFLYLQPDRILFPTKKFLYLHPDKILFPIKKFPYFFGNQKYLLEPGNSMLHLYSIIILKSHTHINVCHFWPKMTKTESIRIITVSYRAGEFNGACIYTNLIIVQSHNVCLSMCLLDFRIFIDAPLNSPR